MAFTGANFRCDTVSVIWWEDWRSTWIHGENTKATKKQRKKQRKKETMMGSGLVYTSFRFETSSTWLVAVLVATRALRPTTLQRMALASCGARVFRVGELCHDWCKGSRRRRLNLAAGETCKSKQISCGIGERIGQADERFGREQETSGYAGRRRPVSWMGRGMVLGSWIGPWCIWIKICLLYDTVCVVLHVFWICICICVWWFCIYYISKSFIVLMKLRFFRYIW